MNMNAFKWLGMAKKYYMKCQETTWEEMKKCSSAWASAADQGKQPPLGTSALIQTDRVHSSPWVKQMLETENFNITAKNIFVFWQHLVPAQIRDLRALHNENRNMFFSCRPQNTNSESIQRVGGRTPPRLYTPDYIAVNYIKFCSGVWQWKISCFVSPKVHPSFWKAAPPKMALWL